MRALYTGTGGWDIVQGYDGDRQRVKKIEGGQTILYLRSTVLGGQIVGEYHPSGTWLRGYVYDGNGQLLAMQAGGVQWVHSDPVTKSKRVTDRWGNSIATIDVDPWGGATSRMENGGALSQKYTTYERDGNGRDQAMMRSYHAWFSRFDQPDPFDGSYDLTDPQTFNRYAYVNNDPVNFIDPSGLQDTDPYSGDPPPPGGWPPIDPNEPPERVFTNIWSMDFLSSGGRLGGGIRPRLYRLESPRGTPHGELPKPVTQENFSHTVCVGPSLVQGCIGCIVDGEGLKPTIGASVGPSLPYSYLGTVNKTNTSPNVYITGALILVPGISFSTPVTHPISGFSASERNGGTPQANVGVQVVLPPLTGPTAEQRRANPHYSGQGWYRFGPGRCMY